MRRARSRLALVALVLVPLAAAGCAFEGQIAVQLLGGTPAVVKQSAKVELTPNRVQGKTTRRGQVVRIDCSVTGVFDVREATGSAVLIQLYVVHLRTRPLPRGVPYELDCAGPLIAQLPADVSDVSATATDSAGQQVALPVQSPVTAIPLAFGRASGPSWARGSPSRACRTSQAAAIRSNWRSHCPRLGRSGRRPSMRRRSLAAVRSTSSRSDPSSRAWPAYPYSRSCRRRTRPASLSRTSSEESGATGRQRKCCRAPGKGSPVAPLRQVEAIDMNVVRAEPVFEAPVRHLHVPELLFVRLDRRR
jgi:hypothetical protein